MTTTTRKLTAEHDDLTTHPLSPHRLNVQGIDAANGDMCGIGWVERHYDALAHPTTTERIVLDLARTITTLEVRHGDDGYAIPHVLAPMLDAFLAYLNMDLGRLDGGTCERFAWSVAERIGWNLDTDTWT